VSRGGTKLGEAEFDAHHQHVNRLPKLHAELHIDMKSLGGPRVKSSPISVHLHGITNAAHW
jgi:hypothetical protein